MALSNGTATYARNNKGEQIYTGRTRRPLEQHLQVPTSQSSPPGRLDYARDGLTPFLARHFIIIGGVGHRSRISHSSRPRVASGSIHHHSRRFPHPPPRKLRRRNFRSGLPFDFYFRTLFVYYENCKISTTDKLKSKYISRGFLCVKFLRGCSVAVVGEIRHLPLPPCC